MRDVLECAIYVDTGFAYPETLALVEYARTILPVHTVSSDRAGQNKREGIPSDVVPIDWTNLGQSLTDNKPVRVQSYLGCCYENISAPLWKKAKELGVTELVYGQRTQEGHKSPARDGVVIDGIKRRHPIEGWTDAGVLDYLASKMDVPAHFHIKHSSLDCYDCTAFRRVSSDRVTWTRAKHPKFYRAYRERSSALEGALLEALAD